MDLFEEELKKYMDLRESDDRLESMSEYLREGILMCYETMSEEERKNFDIAVDVVNHYLITVAGKRGLDISEEESYDIDKVLDDTIDVYEGFEDFDVSFYKDSEALYRYFAPLFADATADEAESYLANLKVMSNGFRWFIEKHVAKLVSSLFYLCQEATEDVQMNVESEADFVSDEDFWSEFPDFEPIDPQYLEVYSETRSSSSSYELTDEDIIVFLRCINILSKLNTCLVNSSECYKYFCGTVKDKKLLEFFSNESFMHAFNVIMEHDMSKNTFYFHGTHSLEDAYSISRQGLGMMRERLDATAYPELSLEELILYQRGSSYEIPIGRDAVVIIDQPREGESIVEKKPSDYAINFGASGLQWAGEAEFLIRPEHIVGFVDKVNKKVVFNPEYYDYDRFRGQDVLGKEDSPEK